MPYTYNPFIEGLDYYGTPPVLSGTISDHGQLTGLGDDDHAQYLLADGTRVMTGALDLDGSSINNINVVNLKAICCTVHNCTGATLIAGTGVYPSGVVGGVVCVNACDSTDATKMPCLGVISTDIINGANGKAVCRGIKSMDTSDFAGSVGDRVYVQPDGSINTTRPTSGSIQRVGLLTVKAVNGQVYIHSRGRKSIFAAANEHPEIRMGNGAGHQKVCFLDYTNNEVGCVDSNGNLTLSGTVDGVDIAIFKSNYDGHDHDGRYYTEAEVDALTWVESDIIDLDKYTQAEVNTISGTLQTNIDGKDNYSSWSFAVDGVTKDTITSGDILNFVGGANITVTRSADDEITISGATGTGGTTDHSALTNLDYASAGHTGFQPAGDYATDAELTTVSGDLQTNIDGKSDTGHTHTESDITDLDKYTKAEVNTISGALSTEIDSDISTHASSADHDGRYYTETEVDALTWTESDITDLDKYTKAEVDTISGSLQTNIDGKSDTGHTHDDRYYTETETDIWRNSTTQTEMGYVHGVTSDIQTQLNDKVTDAELTTVSGDLQTNIDAKDNYSSWSFAIDGVTKDAVTSGDILNFVGGDNIAIIRSSDDEITISGTDTYETIYIDAAAMIPCTTNGALQGTNEYSINNIDIDYFAFDSGSTEERVQFKLKMPENWNKGTIKVKFDWSSATGSTVGDSVEWAIKSGALSNDDPIDEALGTPQIVSDVLLTNNGTDLQTTSATPDLTVGGTPTSGDLLIFEIYRNTSGTDDCAEDALLFGVTLQYKKTGVVIAW